MNADKIVDKLRELKWHIDDDGEKQLREVLSGEGVASEEAKIGAERYEYVRKLNPTPIAVTNDGDSKGGCA